MRIALLVAAILLESIPAAHGKTPPEEPTSESIHTMLARVVDDQRRAPGVIISRIGPRGSVVVGYGRFGTKDGRTPDESTVFEIGSITKILTALLLADMVDRGEVTLDAPVSELLPKGARIPAWPGRPITLLDLATHTSGLPLRPTNLASSHTALNKYAGYAANDLYAGLATYKLSREPGTVYEYSNWGYALLGAALAHRTDMKFETLLQTRVLLPLGMTDTAFVATPPMLQRLAPGHDEQLRPVGLQEVGAIAPATGLLSTARDLRRFLEAMLGKRKSTLTPALQRMLAVSKPSDDRWTTVALGWRTTTLDGQAVVWSNGRADGYRSYIGLDRDQHIGVVALANAGTGRGVDDVGAHLVNAHFPADLRQPGAQVAIAVATDVLDRYVGDYKYADGTVFTVRRKGARLLGKYSEDEDPFELHALTAESFFMTDVDATFTFEKLEGGKSQHAVLRQNGKSFTAQRVR